MSVPQLRINAKRIVFLTKIQAANWLCFQQLRRLYVLLPIIKKKSTSSCSSLTFVQFISAISSSWSVMSFCSIKGLISFTVDFDVQILANEYPLARIAWPYQPPIFQVPMQSHRSDWRTDEFFENVVKRTGRFERTTPQPRAWLAQRRRNPCDGSPQCRQSSRVNFGTIFGLWE